jgi:hypothetical protein
VALRGGKAHGLQFGRRETKNVGENVLGREIWRTSFLIRLVRLHYSWLPRDRCLDHLPGELGYARPSFFCGVPMNGVSRYYGLDG